MSSNLLLHKAVFVGDHKQVEKILEKSTEEELNSQDIHGNTALHIATMKGDKHCVEQLVKRGASTTIRNELNWTSFDEAISYGDFHIIKILNDAITRRVVKFLKRDFIFEAIEKVKEDFVLKFEIRLKDFKPVSVIERPELNITLTKKGLKMRADLTVLDCFHARPQNYHIFMDLDKKSNSFLKLTVDDLPFYQSVTFDCFEQTFADIFGRESTAEEIHDLMRKENICVKLDNKLKAKDKPLFKKMRTKKIAGIKTHIYESQGLDLTLKTRTEHLKAREGLSPEAMIQRQTSLPPPTQKNISWDQYMNAPKGKFPHLGREVIENSETNRVSIVIGLTDEISFDWKWMLELAQQVVNNKLTTLISESTNDLPKGFPVFIDFPLRSSLYLKWKLKSFGSVANIDDSIFNIPDHFLERLIFRIERD